MVPSLAGAVLPQPGDETARGDNEAAIETSAMLAAMLRIASSGDAQIQSAPRRFILSGVGCWVLSQARAIV